MGEEKDKLISEAVKLWEKSYDNLVGIGDLSLFFSANKNLDEFMNKHGIKPEDLRGSLTGFNIAPRYQYTLKAIIDASSLYLSDRNEPPIESSFVEALGRQEYLFLKCKYDARGILDVADAIPPDAQLTKRSILIAMMKHIKMNTGPEELIDGIKVNELIKHKMQALTPLNSDNEDTLKETIAYKGKKMTAQFKELRDKFSEWKVFKGAHSSRLDVTNLNEGHSNLQLDWHRASAQNEINHGIVINGTSLKELASQFNGFAKEQDVLDFFSKIILKDFNGNDDEKNQAVQYLSTVFHQGGLLAPVSSALSSNLVDKDGKPACSILNNSRDAFVHIQTTAQGFKVQELVKVVRVCAIQGGVLEAFADEETSVMEPSKNQDCLIQAEAVIAVQFKTGKAKPELIIESNQIKFFHPALVQHLDHRSLVQKIIDYIKNLFISSKVNDLSGQPLDKPVDEQSHDQDNPDELVSASKGL